MKLLLLLILAFCCFFEALATTEIEKEEELKWDNATEVHDREVAKLITALTPYRDQIKNSLRQESEEAMLTCELCGTILPIIRPILALPQGLIKSIVVTVCQQLHLAPRDSVCKPIVDNFAEQVLYILKRPPMENEGSEICGLIAPDCMDRYPELVDWDTNVRGNKPGKAERTPLDAGSTESTIFLQFTDIHLDLNYKMGTNTECGSWMPVCCREEEGLPREGVRPAGMFGDFKCALPEAGWSAMLQDSKQRFPEAKYVFLTGDYVHSAVWQYSEDENYKHISRVINMTLEAYPATTIYPIAGNHEPNVCNMFPPIELWNNSLPTFDLSWMYQSVINPFLERNPQLIPEAEVQRFLEHGYYTIQPEAGLRFIFLNTNFCYEWNMWMGYYAKDIGGQLQWLEGVLGEAERAREAVYLIGHIEPGNCVKPWSAQFNKVLIRFEGIIKAMFSGHEHTAKYRVHFEHGTNNLAETVSIISGSALTDGGNPTYSAYFVDGKRNGRTWGLLRHQLVSLMLGESNSANRAQFEVILDSLDDFGMSEGINGETVVDLMKRMVCDQELMDKYLRFHYKGDDTFSYRNCSIQNKVCMKNQLSTMARSNKNDSVGWDELRDFILTTDCTAGGDMIGFNMILLIALWSVLKYLI